MSDKDKKVEKTETEKKTAVKKKSTAKKKETVAKKTTPKTVAKDGATTTEDKKTASATPKKTRVRKTDSSTTGKRTRKTASTKKVGSDATSKQKQTDKNTDQAVFSTNIEEEVFSWDSVENKNAYSTEEFEKNYKLYQDTFNTIEQNTIVDGKIISKTKKEIIIDVGYKSQGIIPSSQVKDISSIDEGQTVSVYVENIEDKKGGLVLSHKKALVYQGWRKINEALETGEIVEGYVKCRTKGGLIVDLFDLECFLPGSQIDTKPVKDYDMYVDKNMELKVIKINKQSKNVVVSHKALIERELEAQKKQIIATLEKGQVVEGTVKNVTSYGAFIDLGGVDGLIHITDLSWGRVFHPEEILQVEQKINVVILSFDDDKKRIALGLKQLEKHPWEGLDENFKEGDVVKGKVVVITDYGVFVEIKPGIEALLHMSEMSWSHHLKSPSLTYKLGDVIDVKVLTLDRETRKMSVGVKQLTPDPWESVSEKYPIGSTCSGRVTNVAIYGLFLELEEGVEGFIHVSDLDWIKKIKAPSDLYTRGDNIQAVILSINVEDRKLSLGVKQLTESPWTEFVYTFKVGSTHKATLLEITDKKAILSLNEGGVPVSASIKSLKKADGTMPKIEETLDVKIIECNPDAKRISVSHVKVYSTEADTDFTKSRGDGDGSKKRKYKKKDSKPISFIDADATKSTLGDVNALSELKDKLREQNEAKKSSSTKDSNSVEDKK